MKLTLHPLMEQQRACPYLTLNILQITPECFTNIVVVNVNVVNLVCSKQH